MKRQSTAERLKLIMEQRNLKQVDILNLTLPICARYNVKMNKSDISQYVSGKTEPSQEKLVVLGMALNISESWLMGFDVPMNPNDSAPASEPVLTSRDERDIKRDLDSIMDKLTQGEDGPAAYDGQELSPEAAELFRDELEIALRRLKLINKEKYNPHKNGK